MTYTRNMKCCLLKLEMPEMFAEQFLSGSYQSYRADHKTTSSTRFHPIWPTLNDIYGDRVKELTDIEEKLNNKTKQKCPQKFPPTHSQYSVVQRQQTTGRISIKNSRGGTNTATNSTYPVTQLRTGYCPCYSYLSRIYNKANECCP